MYAIFFAGLQQSESLLGEIKLWVCRYCCNEHIGIRPQDFQNDMRIKMMFEFTIEDFLSPSVSCFPSASVLTSLVDLRCAEALSLTTRGQWETWWAWFKTSSPSQDFSQETLCPLTGANILETKSMWLRPFLNHIKAMERKRQKDLEKENAPHTPAPKVKTEPKSARRSKW